MFLYKLQQQFNQFYHKHLTLQADSSEQETGDQQQV